MTKRIFVCVFLFFLNFCKIKGQVISKGIYIGDTTCSVQCYFDNSDRKLIDKLCLQSCVFIQFQIDHSGKPINIEFNNLAPLPIREWVSAALESTTGKWIFTDKKLRKRVRRKKYVLLPFVFSFFSSNCDSKDSSFKNILGMLNFEPPTIYTGEPEIATYLKASYFNGILLNPVLLVSRYHWIIFMLWFDASMIFSNLTKFPFLAIIYYLQGQVWAHTNHLLYWYILLKNEEGYLETELGCLSFELTY